MPEQKGHNRILNSPRAPWSGLSSTSVSAEVTWSLLTHPAAALRPLTRSRETTLEHVCPSNEPFNWTKTGLKHEGAGARTLTPTAESDSPRFQAHDPHVLPGLCIRRPGSRRGRRRDSAHRQSRMERVMGTGKLLTAKSRVLLLPTVPLRVLSTPLLINMKDF